MKTFQRGFTHIIIFTGLALLLIAICVEYFQYQRNQTLLLTDLKNRLDEHTANVNLRARTAQGYVTGLKVAAENALYSIKQMGVSSPLYSYLKEDPEKGTYSLDVQSLKQVSLTDLRGQGNLVTLPDNVKQELNMALMLNPFFEMALKNTRGALWVYYTSNHDFQNIYPWVPSFKREASRSLNRGGGNVWSIAYPLKDQGWVVTNYSPVFDDGRFIGTVSLDFSLNELGRIMKRIQPLQGNLYLINDIYQILGSHAPLDVKEVPMLGAYVTGYAFDKIKEEMKDPSDWFTTDGPSLIYVAELHETPWYVVYIVPKSELFAQLFQESIEDLVVVSLLILFVMVFGYIFATRNFITPAQKLVDHISKENKGLESSPQHIPDRWKPWFDIVSEIFAENRVLLTDLEKRIKERTTQLEHRNVQLETALTDLKKAQKQIIVQEKLASLGALTAGIAHEIKNPLNFIINFSELSLEYLQDLKDKVSTDPELFGQIKENMEKTIDHAHRADGIVKSMLAHARGGTGEITSFNINQLLEETTDLAISGFTKSLKIKVTKELDSHGGVIKGSKQDIARVFLNIINNACFALQEKGDTSQADLKIKSEDLGSRVRISIEDNGIGMTKATLKKLFTPFFSTKKTGQGTGLGLSISYDIIVHQHHGELKAESELGSFTRFIIELPRDQGGANE